MVMAVILYFMMTVTQCEDSPHPREPEWRLMSSARIRPQFESCCVVIPRNCTSSS